MGGINGSAIEDLVPGLEEYEDSAALAAVKLYTDYPEWLLQFAGACCILFMVIGIPGNLVTIIALARCRKVRNATAIFIINLSCSDLLFCCFVLPLQTSIFYQRAWIHGKLLCRLLPLARYALVAVSLFTILAITINRYIMISFPMLYPRLYRNRYLWIMIAGLWLFPTSVLIPTYFEEWGRFSLDPITGSCSIVADENELSPKKFLFIAAFVLPSLAIIICYARIWWIVRKAAKMARIPMYTRPVSAMEAVQMSSKDARTSKSQSKKNLNQISPLQKDGRCQLALGCFLNTGAELSSVESSIPEEQDSGQRPRTLGAESMSNIRKSFVATFKRPSGPPKPRLPTKKDKKLLTMIVAIMVSFLVCHLPITLTKTVFQDFKSHPTSNIIGYVLIYITTCVNPIIYVVMSNEYRQAYKNLWKCGR
ncbi:G-protein coupled receptor moody-like [Manduca sexta]|uniref:G-protein coupled receptor moody-like n=1 Tax=Manduca sexta TaxID=7130 RepID=UPI001890A505|nr:G-protein coupled receptor moody-like [Manduca sexta]